MIIFLHIKNDEKLNYAKLRYWMIDHCQKWILYKSKPEAFSIFVTNSYNRLDNVLAALKCLIQGQSQKGVFFLKSDFNIFKTYKINGDDKFLETLKKYFRLNDTNIHNDWVFKNFELKGYTKKTIISLFNKKKEIEDSTISKIDDKTCDFCLKEFKNKYIKKNHLKICKKNTSIPNIENNIELIQSEHEKNQDLKLNIETIINNKVESIVNNKIDNIASLLKDLKEDMNAKVQTINNTNNNLNVNNVNNVNIQINNYKTKKDKLNQYLKDMIDLDTFTENYKNDPKYHLTKDEALVLLENSEKLGVPSYGEGLYTYIKKKYCLQLEDLTGKKQQYHESFLPFICSDINLRRHYELEKDGWKLVKDTDKIKKIVNISDQQIFNHHNKFVCYSKKGKNTVVNIFLRKSDYSEIESEFDNLLESVTNTNNNLIENEKENETK